MDGSTARHRSQTLVGGGGADADKKKEIAKIFRGPPSDPQKFKAPLYGSKNLKKKKGPKIKITGQPHRKACRP